MADTRSLGRRLRSRVITHSVPWKRLVGGKFGVIIEMPAGTYSDDTQLRLATSRAIRGDGYFDVEAFAKVELPVWLSYALGAGSSTKTAAYSLSQADVNWFSNFFEKESTSYFQGGGNGAAMRVQPHVWALAPSKVDLLMREVLRNAICTHGHLRGIAGAAFHALALSETLRSGEIAGISHWREIAKSLSGLADIAIRDHDIGTFWLPVWEERTKIRFRDAVETVIKECLEDIELIGPFCKGAPEMAYVQAARAIGGLKPETRGSGLKTALLASVLAWLYRDESPGIGLATSANLLGSDTDTVATMAGAILGAVSQVPPNSELQDREYIEKEAIRLWGIATNGDKQVSFRYPDLMNWRPPRAAIDIVKLEDGMTVVEGLGPASPAGEQIEARTKDGTCWRWFQLQFGQTILAKHRRSLKERMPDKPSQRSRPRTTSDEEMPTRNQADLFTSRSRQPIAELNANSHVRSVDDLTSEAIRTGFDHATLGRHLMQLSEDSEGIERAIAYTAIIAKARRARLASHSKKESGLTRPKGSAAE